MPIDTVAPPRGEGRTLKVVIRFSTNSIAEQPDHIRKGWCRDAGFVNIHVQPQHGITKRSTTPFNNLAELDATILDALHKAGVRMIYDPRARR